MTKVFYENFFWKLLQQSGRWATLDAILCWDPCFFLIYVVEMNKMQHIKKQFSEPFLEVPLQSPQTIHLL